MTLSEELTWRGFVNQTTLEDIARLDRETFTFYLGVDPSADSMTIGNLAAVMMVKHFIDHGHKAYLLVGGATGIIGDPDGKSSERVLLSREQLEQNKTKIAKQYKKLLSRQDFTLVDNYDWFKGMNYLDFLRDIGKHVPVGQMLSRDFVQKRLGADGSGISYAEFSYSLIQGYDFLFQFREYGVNLQLCGADQWGNCVTGVDLIRRIEGKEANVFSAPLIVNKSTGQKFGKTEDGAVWLDADKTSVYSFYQFWLNTDDASVIELLKIYTLLDKESIENLSGKVTENPAERAAQKTLAREVTLLVHGAERTESVERVTGVLFGNADFNSLHDDDIAVLANEIPAVGLNRSVIDTLVESGLVSSNGEAKRLIEGKAISVNSEKISADKIITERSLIKKGKNSFVLVK